MARSRLTSSPTFKVFKLVFSNVSLIAVTVYSSSSILITVKQTPS